MKINYETLPLPADRGQTVIVYSADAGSPSEEKLKLLVSWTAQSALTDS